MTTAYVAITRLMDHHTDDPTHDDTVPDTPNAVRYAAMDTPDVADIIGTGVTSQFAHTLIEWMTELTTDERSQIRLDLSLCPMHGIDYAICFDDDNPECAAIRAVFPSHDT